MIRPGELRHEIAIQVLSNTLDAYGQQTQTWNPFFTCRAAVARTPGQELFKSADRVGRVPTVFRLRYFPFAISPDMRVSWDGRIFNIKSVIDPTGLKAELLITTEELVGGT